MALAGAAAIWGVARRDGPAAADGPPRLAVLPFANLGPAADDALGVGLALEVQRNLTRLERLVLLSFGSPSTFAQDERRLVEASAALRADLILDGAVRRAPGALQVRARLVQMPAGLELWSETFDRPDAEVFAVLDDIAKAIVDRLRLELRLPRRHETRPDLFYQFLAAQARHARRHETDSLEAARLFQEIVDRDPEYAPAWAGLASALSHAHRLRAADRNEPADPRIRAAALRAIALDDLLASAHAALGNVLSDDQDWAAAEAAFRGAIALNPSLTSTHTDFALTVLMPLNRTAEAVALLADAIDRDPQSLDVRRVLAHFLVNAGRYDEAIAASQWVLDRDPTFPFTSLWLGRALTLSGRAEEAVPIFAANPSYWAYLGYTYAVMGRREEAEALAAAHPDDPRGLMMVYSGLGETERAIQALERLAAGNPWRAATWLHRPEMAPIHADPRVDAIVRELRLR